MLFEPRKEILGYSPLDCLIPIIPPEIVPRMFNVESVIVITGVSIYIVPPLVFKVSKAVNNAFSSSVVIVAISSSSKICIYFL